MRCLVLADALREQGRSSLFLCGPLPAGLDALVRERGHELYVLPRGCDDPGGWAADAGTSCAQLREAGAVACVVVDHYCLDARWEARLRAATGARIMAVDDIADRPHDCDLLLDQNLYADMPGRYATLVPAACNALLGPHYTLLDRRFRQLRGDRARGEGAVRRLLVSFGGSDPPDLTSATLRALRGTGFAGLQVDVVLGSGNPHRDTVQRLCADMPAVHLHVQTARMAQLLAETDLVIGAGGVSAWERCCMGVPSLSFAVADNQIGQLHEMARSGLTCAPEPADDMVAAISLHLRALMADPDLRGSLSRRSMEVVDGLGAPRVAQQLLSTAA